MLDDVVVVGVGRPEPAFSLRREDEATVPVLVVNGAIDVDSSPAFGAALVPFADGEHLVLDLQDLAFIDSIGIRDLISASDRLQRGLHIVAPADAPLMRALDVMGVASRFSVHASRQDAVRGAQR